MVLSIQWELREGEITEADLGEFVERIATPDDNYSGQVSRFRLVSNNKLQGKGLETESKIDLLNKRNYRVTRPILYMENEGLVRLGEVSGAAFAGFHYLPAIMKGAPLNLTPIDIKLLLK